MDSNSIDQLAKSYLEYKSKIIQLEDHLSLLKIQIEQNMEEMNKSKIVTSLYTIEKKPMEIERISKKNVPDDIWNKYAKQYNHTCLYVKPIVKETKRRYTRSRQRKSH
jgi:hypothetical protein